MQAIMYALLAAATLLAAPVQTTARGPVADGLTTDEFVPRFAQALGVEPRKAATFLRGIDTREPVYGYYVALGYAVPNRFFDGKQWQVRREQVVDIGAMIRSYVVHSGVLLYPDAEAEAFLVKQGVLLQDLGFDTADAVYIATLLCNQHSAPRIRLERNRGVREDDVARMVQQFRRAFESRQECKNPTPRYSNVAEDGVRAQHYFADGPIYSHMNIDVRVPPSSSFHQYASIFGKATATNTKVNTVGVWGEARSEASGGRAWGGFFTAETPSGEDKDSQLVGVEVDVINLGKPGVAPNQSKVGMQLVTMGHADSSAAIEVISDHRSRWKNAILVADDSISADGAVIGLGQRQRMRAGIDFSQGTFADAAIRLGNNETLRLDGTGAGGAKAAVIRNDANNALVLVAGAKGMAIQNNDATRTLVFVDNAGNVTFENARPVLVSSSGKRFALTVDDDGKLSTVPLH